MSHAELTPEEADRLTARLLRLCKWRGWSRTRLCRELGVARSTIFRLEHKGFMTRRTATHSCRTLGWEPDNVLLPACARRPPIDALFLPPALQAAARHYRDGMKPLRAQILHAAAANLLINLQACGGRAVINSSDAYELGEILVVTHHFTGLPRAAVSFKLERRRLVYTLTTYADGRTVFDGSGDATAMGFGFCLEFLNQPAVREKLDGRERLEHRIHGTLATYGDPRRTPRRAAD